MICLVILSDHYLCTQPCAWCCPYKAVPSYQGVPRWLGRSSSQWTKDRYIQKEQKTMRFLPRSGKVKEKKDNGKSKGWNFKQNGQSKTIKYLRCIRHEI